MATKTISITEEAYETLRSWKEDNESFSNIILKIGKKNKLSDFVGILSEKSGKDLLKSFKEGRKLSRLRAKRMVLN